jgi:phosphotransferase system enzyme I (PtsP)
MRVHERDDARVDGILRLIEEASRPGPVGEVLQGMCVQVATIAHADVVSVYVREQSAERDALVLRANVGFPESAIGNVRLAMGEGITGTAAEVMRPISASIAMEDSHFKAVPELGEERYPAFVAIPLQLRGLVAGVLVLQRSEAGAFSDAEVALATALATTFSGALDRGLDRHESTPRSAQLRGHKLVDGEAMGRALMLGSLEALRGPGIRKPVQDSAERAVRGLNEVSDLLRRALRKVEPALGAPQRRELLSFGLMLEDQRLQTIVHDRCTELGIVRGFRQVAREYAVATYDQGRGDPLLERRARELESLCLLSAYAAGNFQLPTPGTVLVLAERLTAMLALCVIGGRAEAILIHGPLDPEGLGVHIAAAGQVPLLADIQGLFAWTRAEDTLLVDATHGLVRVNPPATLIAAHRKKRQT